MICSPKYFSVMQYLFKKFEISVSSIQSNTSNLVSRGSRIQLVIGKVATSVGGINLRDFCGLMKVVYYFTNRFSQVVR